MPVGLVAVTIGSSATLRSIVHGFWVGLGFKATIIEALTVVVYPVLLALPMTVDVLGVQRLLQPAIVFSHVMRSWALFAVGLKLAPNAEAIRAILHVRVEAVLEVILAFQDQLSLPFMAVLHALRQLGWMSILHTNMKYTLQYCIIRGFINWAGLMVLSGILEFRNRKSYAAYLAAYRSSARRALPHGSGDADADAAQRAAAKAKDLPTGIPNVVSSDAAAAQQARTGQVAVVAASSGADTTPDRSPAARGRGGSTGPVTTPRVAPPEPAVPGTVMGAAALRLLPPPLPAGWATTPRTDHGTQAPATPSAAVDEQCVQSMAAIQALMLQAQRERYVSRLRCSTVHFKVMGLQPYDLPGELMTNLQEAMRARHPDWIIRNMALRSGCVLMTLDLLDGSVAPIAPGGGAGGGHSVARRVGVVSDAARARDQHMAVGLAAAVSRALGSLPPGHGLTHGVAMSMQLPTSGAVYLWDGAQQAYTHHVLYPFSGGCGSSPAALSGATAGVRSEADSLSGFTALKPQHAPGLSRQGTAGAAFLPSSAEDVAAGAVYGANAVSAGPALIPVCFLLDVGEAIIIAAPGSALEAPVITLSLQLLLPAVHVLRGWRPDGTAPGVCAAESSASPAAHGAPEVMVLVRFATGAYLPVNVLLGCQEPTDGHAARGEHGAINGVHSSSGTTLTSGGTASTDALAAAWGLVRVHVTASVSMPAPVTNPTGLTVELWCKSGAALSTASPGGDPLPRRPSFTPSYAEGQASSIQQQHMMAYGGAVGAGDPVLYGDHMSTISEPMPQRAGHAGLLARPGSALDAWGAACAACAVPLEVQHAWAPLLVLPHALASVATELREHMRSMGGVRGAHVLLAAMAASQQGPAGSWAAQLLAAVMPDHDPECAQLLSDLGAWFRFQAGLLGHDDGSAAPPTPLDLASELRAVGGDLLLHAVLHGLPDLAEVLAVTMHKLARYDGDDGAPWLAALIATTPQVVVAVPGSTHEFTLCSPRDGSPSHQRISLLHAAILSGQPQMLARVISWGEVYGGADWYWDWSLCDDSGCTPLHMVAMHPKCADYLSMLSAMLCPARLEAAQVAWMSERGGLGATPVAFFLCASTAPPLPQMPHIPQVPPGPASAPRTPARSIELQPPTTPVNSTRPVGALGAKGGGASVDESDDPSLPDDAPVDDTRADAYQGKEGLGAAMRQPCYERTSPSGRTSTAAPDSHPTLVPSPGISHPSVTPTAAALPPAEPGTAGRMSAAPCKLAPTTTTGPPPPGGVHAEPAGAESEQRSLTAAGLLAGLLVPDPDGYRDWLAHLLRPCMSVWCGVMLCMLCAIVAKSASHGRLWGDLPVHVLCLGGYLPAGLATWGYATQHLGPWQAWALPLMLLRATSVLLPSLGLLPFPPSYEAGLNARTELLFEAVLLTGIEQMPLRELCLGRAAMTVACWRAYAVVARPAPLLTSLALNAASVAVAAAVHVGQLRAFGHYQRRHAAAAADVKGHSTHSTPPASSYALPGAVKSAPVGPSAPGLARRAPWLQSPQ